MSFLNKSVNYSQTELLKLNILSPLLVSYNDFLIKKDNKSDINLDINTGISYDYLIPNNNKKYYLLITKKHLLETNNSLDDKNRQTKSYDILYLYPDQYNSEKDNCSDFYMEIDHTFNDELLLEGYLYKNENKYHYLLTDILIKNKKIIDVSFELRYTLLNEIIKTIRMECLKELNNHMTINIHPVFDMANTCFVKIFKNNFTYKDKIVAVENISNFVKNRYVDKIRPSDIKRVEIGRYTDVYNVYNSDTNNHEGILYVKGIMESKRLKEMFDQNNIKTITLKCCWNTKFSKWQPIF
jgi:hypothetical protein